MSHMANLKTLLNQLERERSTISAQLERLNAALTALGSNANSGRRGRISTTGRARIAAAQRARWAKVRGAKVVAITDQRKRKISAAAIARIRAARKRLVGRNGESNRRLHRLRGSRLVPVTYRISADRRTIRTACTGDVTLQEVIDHPPESAPFYPTHRVPISSR